MTGHGGGPEKTLLASPKFISSRYQLRLAYIRPASDEQYDMPVRAASAGVMLLDIPESGPFDVRTINTLVREIRQHRPKILHAHDYKTNFLATFLGRWFNIPAVTTAHGYVTVGGRLNWYYRLDRWALKRMSRVIAVSEDLHELMLTIGVAPSRCVLVENGIDCQEFSRTMTTDAAKRSLGLSPEPIVVGAVGRLSREKGFDVLIGAVDQLIRQGINLQLLVLGDGDERTPLQSLIDSLGQHERIRLLGHRSDTIDYYQAMDVFVLSSLREGLPNVLLEAMAMEIPVIATNIGGVPKLVVHNENGVLVKPGDVRELTSSLQQVLCDADLRTRLVRTARTTVENRFSFAVRTQKVEKVYDDLLASYDHN